ncbi:MAG: TonB-dependent receptor [Candidatus Marinimicrobia bacterium]|nr:TonB-dependent receptor [Candidatus Neomarinimicrobiota bacterium]
MNRKIYFLKKWRWVLLMLVWCPTMSAARAAQSIHGFIRDDASGEPVPYANVILKGTQQGAVSNTEGYYVISSVPVGQDTLLVSIIGYELKPTPVQVALDDNVRLDVRLTEEVLAGEAVTVTAERQKFRELVTTSTMTLQQRDIEVAPSFVEADVFRAIQMLPGVQAINDFSSALYVRGSTPDQNLIMLDGITVYNPSHLGGVFSTFNTDAIKEADFRAGGFEARYGGRMGSILNIVNREGNTEEFAGKANISFLSSKLLLEGPLPGNSENSAIKGSWMLAGRRTYIDAIVNGLWQLYRLRNRNAVNPDGSPVVLPAQVFPYYFYDFQGKLNLDIGSKHRLTWSSFYGDDVFYLSDSYENEYRDFSSNPADPSAGYRSVYQDSYRFDWQWGNFTNSLTWRWILSPKIVAKTFLASSRYRFQIDTDLSDERWEYEVSDTSHYKSTFGMDIFDRVSDRTLETELTWFAAPNHTVTGGWQFKTMAFNLGMDFTVGETEEDTFYTRRDTLLWMLERPREQALFIQDKWEITNLLSAQVGLRLSQYSLHPGKFYPEPRLGLKYFLLDNLSLKAAWGVYNQFLGVANPPEANFHFIDIWLAIPEDYPASRSLHYILGAEYLTAGDILLRSEVYYKSFDHLLTLKPPTNFQVGQDVQNMNPFNEFYDTQARAYGMEWLVKKTTGKVRGWIGYTLAVTQRKNEVNDWYHPKYDRTHTLNMVADWQWNEEWHASTAVTYSSGNPYTPILARTEDYYFYDWGDETGWDAYSQYLYGDMNSERYPGYFRWDMSFSKRTATKWGSKEWFFQVVNVTNHLNILTYIYDQDFDWRTGQYKGVRRFGVPMFPFMPTVGVKYEF